MVLRRPRKGYNHAGGISHDNIFHTCSSVRSTPALCLRSFPMCRLLSFVYRVVDRDGSDGNVGHHYREIIKPGRVLVVMGR